jgi:rhamnogalacturonyl hydrolase YesR
MNRRHFIARAALGGSAILLGPGCSATPSDSTSGNSSDSNDSNRLLDRVKLAMLAMQRYAWEQGVAAQALLESGDTETMVLMAKDAVLRQWDDGRLAVVSENHGVTDPAANGEPVLRAAELTGDSGLADGARRMRDYLMSTAPRTKDGTLHHVDDKPQVWIDSMYMAPPFLAVIGEPAEAVRQIDGMTRLLWDTKAGLYSQIWDDGKKSFHRADHWGVGNGWAAAGTARVIAALPPEMTKERQRLVALVHKIVDGCLKHQREDGLFHDVVDDPGSFVETNLAQMLAYTIYRGVAGGWMDDSSLAKAETMRRAAAAKIDRFGLVQGVCGAPNFDSSGTATEGQAFCLLMHAAHRDLLKSRAADQEGSEDHA